MYCQILEYNITIFLKIIIFRNRMKQGTVVKVSDVARGPFFNIEGGTLKKVSNRVAIQSKIADEIIIIVLVRIQLIIVIINI